MRLCLSHVALSHVPRRHFDLKGRCTTVASSEPHPTEPIHADRSRARDVHASHLGCAHCMQPLGDQIPSRCPECGVALDPANPRSVCDLRNRRDRVELIMALAAGIVVGGLLAFGGWFGLMKHNRWLPILNLLVPIVGLAAGPAILCARLPRVRLAIAYAIGSWSFLGWYLLAIAIDQLQQGASITGLGLDFRGTFVVGGPVVVVTTAVGIGLGGLVRVIVRRTRPKA